MYAIVKTGGKQYKAASSDILIVEKIEGDLGAKVELDEVVLLAGDSGIMLGSPFVKGAKVHAEIVRQCKGPKINGYNYKAKKNQRKRWGHRQFQTHLKVLEVIAG